MTDSNSILPHDQAVREEFAHSIDVNISLLAPAGSGKTRAISDRIVTIAQAEDAIRRLPRAVVVTYTNKAADEGRQRAGAALRASGAGEKILSAFEQAFFGTIHSFGSHLLREFGHYIGVPAGFEVAPQVGLLWKSYLLSEVSAVNDEMNARVLRHVAFRDIQGSAEGALWGRDIPIVPEAIPALKVDDIMAFLPKDKRSAKTVARGQHAIAAFAELWNSGGDGFAELPGITAGGEAFIELCEKHMADVRAWLRKATAVVAGRLFADFRRWRVANGLLTYDDQVSLAAELFKHRDAARAIRECGYSVILDEAQDTDAAQFTLLIEATRPVDVSDSWRDEGAAQPAPGRFCMVGDFQQAIYSSRADVSVCRSVHDYITRNGAGRALTFTTTFRCDQKVLDFVNQVGPAMLNGEAGQVSYVPLETRYGAGPGEVIRLPFEPMGEDFGPDERLQCEGRKIGAFLKAHGLSGLGITAWNQVAILAPRTDWLRSLARGLTAEGIKSATLSSSERNCDHPAYLWTTATATVLSEQRNTWEIAGLLRDVFGISDRELARFTQGKGERLRMDHEPVGSGIVTDALNTLRDLRRRTHALPLRDAMEIVDVEFLRPRLLALPIDIYGDPSEQIDRLTALAAKVESEGGDMTTFAKRLRDGLESKPESNSDNPGAVSLLTNHKAKGLEWPVVILPAMFREFSFQLPRYPRVIGPSEGTLDIAFRKEDAFDHDKLARRVIKNEIGRLAYVSLTRAKRLMVICDDNILWGADKAPELSLAGALAFDGFQSIFEGLPCERRETLTPDKDVALPLSENLHVDLIAACEASQDAPLKVTPHKLAKDHDREGVEARRDDTLPAVPFASTQYGTWWHETMRRMPWGQPQAWDEYFRGAIDLCPQRERALVEWDLFSASSLALTLRSATIIRTECSFIVPIDVNVLEGVIDLIFRDAQGQWHVLDWKTTQSMDIQSAIAEYSPQVRPYRDVVGGFLGQAVSAVIYLTSKGDLGAVA